MASETNKHGLDDSVDLIESSKAKLATRRTFLKGSAAAGAIAAMYAVPKFTSVHSRPAYANITDATCRVTWCATWTDSAGAEHSVPISPINTGLSASAYYGYGNPDAASANTPDGLEDANSDTALFFLLRDGSGDINLGTIFDKPNDGDGGSANVSYSGLPSDVAWSVEDDNEAPGHSTDGAGGATTSVNWIACCTDGGMLSSASGGLNCACKITITINSSSGISVYKVYSSDGTKTIVPSTFCIEAKPV